MKKIQSVLVAVFIAVILSGSVFSAFSANEYSPNYPPDEIKTSGVLEYVELNKNSVKIVRYTGNSSKFTIPSKIGGKSVVRIGASAFRSCKNLTSLVIPGSVKHLEDMAVCYCAKLKTITIKKGKLEKIGPMAFYCCSNLKTINLPENMRSIELFYDCNAIEKVVVNSENKYLRSYDGVVYSKNLKKLIYYPPGKKDTVFIVPESVNEISRGAFNHAKNLEKVFVPKTVKKIGETAFGYTSVTICYEGSKVPDELYPAFYPWEVICNSKPLEKVKISKISKTPISVTLSWKKVAGADGYRISIYNSATKKYETLATISKTEYTVKNLVPGKAYRFSVKAYAKTVSGNVWSDSTVKKNIKPLPATPVLSVSSDDSVAVLKWKKVTDADGYVIYYSTSKKGTYKKLAVTSGTSFSKKLKSDTYYFKVRAFVKTESGNVYGGFSGIKSCKVK